MDVIDLAVAGRRYIDVAVPTKFVERWRGMRAASGAMLLDTSSVHGFGMDRDLLVVGIDADDDVIAVRILRRGRPVRIRGARRILELELSSPVPCVGDRVWFYDRRDGGTSRGVCHSDRKSR